MSLNLRDLKAPVSVPHDNPCAWTLVAVFSKAVGTRDSLSTSKGRSRSWTGQCPRAGEPTDKHRLEITEKCNFNFFLLVLSYPPIFLTGSLGLGYFPSSLGPTSNLFYFFYFSLLLLKFSPLNFALFFTLYIISFLSLSPIFWLVFFFCLTFT